MNQPLFISIDRCLWRLKASAVAHRSVKVRRLALLLGVALSTALLPRPAQAANLTIQGTIGTDDAVQLFNLTVATAGSVDLRSYGYAGGTTSTGTVVPRGGFDTILTLFSASGAFLTENDDGVGIATDPSTGLAADSRITANLAAGSYLLALTQFDNFSRGTLADGFVETGHPNFTADPSFATGGACPGNLFRDISGTAGRCRTGNWTVDFTNVASVTPAAPVPEPSTAGLLGLSFLGCAWMVRRKKPHRSQLLPVLLPVLFLGAWSAQAQQSKNPDYSKVTDILQGKRTVVQTTDLAIVQGQPNPFTPVFTQITTANSQQTVSTSYQWGNLPETDSSRPLRTFSARMFNQSTSITLTTLYKVSSPYFTLWLTGTGAFSLEDGWSPLPPDDQPDVNAGTVADFTQDGFDDLALGFADGRILVVTPNDVTNESKGFRSSITTLDVLKDMAAGDFNGDGQREIAGLTSTPSGGLQLVIYTVDPKSLAVTPASSLPLTVPNNVNPSTPITHVSIARGQFNTAAHDQLAVAFATDSGSVYVEVIDFDPNTLTPREKPQGVPTVPGISLGKTGSIQVKTGRFFLPGNPYDQIVYNNASSNSAPNSKFLEILKVDPTSLAVGGTVPVHYDQLPYPAEIEVGNFDHRQPDPLHSGQTELNPNAQIAFLYYSAASAYTLNIYSVDPNSFNVNANPDSAINLPYSSGSPSTPITFAATDLQGRSYILGAPAKVVLNGSTQPSVVLAMPPMHVDWVAPVNSKTPELLDVSAAPHGFHTSYDVDTSKTDESSTSDTTSFSFGAKETVGASFSIGDVDAGEGLQVKDVFTATQDLKKSVQNESGTTHQETYKLGASTLAGDYVLYTESRFNIWVYPVIGQTVCPATKPNCQPNEKVPLTIQFSAPDQTSHTSGSGINIEWYQPPWEPFNVLSYPANLTQLQAVYPSLQPIATTTEAFTDQGQLSQQVNWTNGSTSSQTASFDQNNSYENDLSVTAAVNFGEVGFGFEGGVDISGSQGFSTLNKSVTSYSSSTGIGVSSLGSFLDPPNYRYPLTPIIFGSAPPTGAVDRSPLNTDVQAYGLIRTAFTADPARGGNNAAGGWWSQAYSLPDVALNRPAHWQLTTPTGDGAATPNCLAWGSGGSQIDCFSPGTFAPQTPWTSEFHFMRGFFISNAAHPGQGPQLSLATAGDQLSLQARVYNYSLTSMPDNTTVHVRFYAQPIDGTNQPKGPSFFIGEDTLTSISPFNDGSDLNWKLASVTFDTTGHAGQTVGFWVVVWMQGPDGKLVTEMPGHGLKAIPGTLNSLADVPTEDYSNNVGFYKVAFTILSPLGGGLGDSSNSSPVPVNIGKIRLSATQVTLNQPITVSAPLSVPASAALGVTAQFYDGDPQNGGDWFDIERTAYLEANQGRDATVIYRPSSCGTHNLFVVVNKGLPNEVVRRAEPVRVDCTQSMLRMSSAGQKLTLK